MAIKCIKTEVVFYEWKWVINWNGIIINKLIRANYKTYFYASESWGAWESPRDAGDQFQNGKGA